MSVEPSDLPLHPNDLSGGTVDFHVRDGSVHEGKPTLQIQVQRPDWDTWALSVAFVVATRADCTRRQVGAVILDPLNQIVSTGYNGAPAGVPGCKSMNACPRGQLSYSEVPAGASYSGNCTAVHAEDNAIRQAQARGIELADCAIYVTHQPCYGCKEVIRASGIDKVYIPNPEYTGVAGTPRVVAADMEPEVPVS